MSSSERIKFIRGGWRYLILRSFDRHDYVTFREKEIYSSKVISSHSSKSFSPFFQPEFHKSNATVPAYDYDKVDSRRYGTTLGRQCTPYIRVPGAFFTFPSVAHIRGIDVFCNVVVYAAGVTVHTSHTWHIPHILRYVRSVFVFCFVNCNPLKDGLRWFLTNLW